METVKVVVFLIENMKMLYRHTENVFLIFFLSSLLLSSSTRGRFYPQRSSGQAVVTGVIPSPPRYVHSIFITHRVQHSHCSSIFIECCQLSLSRFALIIFLLKKKSLRVCALGEN